MYFLNFEETNMVYRKRLNFQFPKMQIKSQSENKTVFKESKDLVEKGS